VYHGDPSSFERLVRSRRMTRSFLPVPVDADVRDRLLSAARRAPSAGNSQGTHFLVLEGAALDRYWQATLPSGRRGAFAFPGLLRAPLLVVVYADPQAYVERYAEADKSRTGLGAGPEAWPVPYWLVDAAFAAMLLQLAAVDAGLGVLFFGLFQHERAVGEAFGVPPGLPSVGALAIGHPDVADDRPGRSAARPQRSERETIHVGRW
jgi:nitroreductase